jgi:hypothetical protein
VLKLTPDLMSFINTGMNISEVARYSGKTTKAPNYWTQVTLLLDKLFKLGSGNDSKLKRIAQGFDQKTGEHVIRLEYRVKADNQNKIAQKPTKVKLKPDDADKKKS